MSELPSSLDCSYLFSSSSSKGLPTLTKKEKEKYESELSINELFRPINCPEEYECTKKDLKKT